MRGLEGQERQSLGERGRTGVITDPPPATEPLQGRADDDHCSLVPLPAGSSQRGGVTGRHCLEAHGSCPDFSFLSPCPQAQQLSLLLTGKAVGNTWQAIPSALYNRAGLQLTELLGENRGSLTTLPPSSSSPFPLG